MKNFHSLPVKEIIRETPRAVSLVFEIPEALKNVFYFESGQYITIKKEFDGQEIRRSYSIASVPGRDYIKVSVKEVAGGLFSTYANRELQEGDVLDVFPPEGKFVYHPPTDDKPNEYAAFVAGSGITPVISILKNVLKKEAHSKFVLVYGNKTPQETIYFKELLAIQQEFPDRVFIEFVYSQAKDKDSFFGRIERSTVNFVLNNKFKNHQFKDIYLCGPEPMIDLVKGVLLEHEIEEERIHFELFTSTEIGEIEANLEGKTKIKVIVDDEEFEFEMDQKESILDAALDEDIDAPYSCQGGICSSCIARIKEGKAEMMKNQILTDEEIEEGLTLTCQAHPTTAKIVIDFDDV